MTFSAVFPLATAPLGVTAEANAIDIPPGPTPAPSVGLTALMERIQLYVYEVAQRHGVDATYRVTTIAIPTDPWARGITSVDPHPVKVLTKGYDLSNKSQRVANGMRQLFLPAYGLTFTPRESDEISLGTKRFILKDIRSVNQFGVLIGYKFGIVG